jgi:hypothetical protein
MGIKRNHQVLTLLFGMVAAVMIIPMLSSCGKDTAASPTGLNTQLNIINIGPDRFPVFLYQNYIKWQQQPKQGYIYSIPSGYFYMSSLDVPLQLRSQQNAVLYTKADSLHTNCKYSMFITGLVAEKTDTVIFTVDTATLPSLGRGKVRFVNAAAHAVTLDVYANGTSAYKNCVFKSVSPYIELPAGVYDFSIYNAGTTNLLTHLPNTTIQDGRLYTLYTRGVVSRIDSASFAAAIITNR